MENTERPHWCKYLLPEEIPAYDELRAAMGSAMLETEDLLRESEYIQKEIEGYESPTIENEPVIKDDPTFWTHGDRRNLVRNRLKRINDQIKVLKGTIDELVPKVAAMVEKAANRKAGLNEQIFG
jgi:hypothetical protein